MSAIIEITDLKISYGFTKAVEGVSLQANQGECVGLLGLNGAGKTSILKATLGMIPFKTGKIQVFGEKPGKVSTLKRLGFAPEDASPAEYLKGPEYLRFVARLRLGNNKSKIESGVEELISDLDLPKDKIIREYSKGMKRRLVLAQAFVGDPELLILDEPLNGLDPILIVKLRNRIEAYRNRAGGSVVYSSHILAEVEKTCTRVAILHKGKLLYDSPIQSLISEFGSVENAFTSKVSS